MRTDWVDLARGIGIVLVVFGHVARGVYAADLPLDEQWFRNADRLIYSFHMPLFFFLSGLFYLSSMARHGIPGFIIEKLRTVAWPYLLWSLLQGITQVALSGYANHAITVHDLSDLLWQPHAQFWFLYALFYLMLACIPVYRAVPERWLCTIPLLTSIPYLFREWAPTTLPLPFLIEYAPYFTLGICYGHYITAQASPNGVKHGNWLLLAFVLVQALASLPVDLPPPVMAAARFGIALVSIAAIVALCQWLSRWKPTWLAVIGRASMAIYVMHIMASSGARIILQKLFGITSLPIHLVIGSMLGILLPLLALKLLEQLRLRRILGV
jgi:fucose 4-O-acetylase-like acetyltransferase